MARRAARALLFVALSGAAVPSCQQYETGGPGGRDQAALSRVAPPIDRPAAPAAVERPRA